jgi:hypothetical protein
MVQDFQRVATLDRTSDTPTCNQYREYGQYSAAKIIQRFDSWNAFVSKAGAEVNRTVGITDEELFADYKRVANRNDTGEVPTREEYREHGKFSSGTARVRFGSWNGFIEAAGMRLNKRESIRPEEFVEDYQELAERETDGTQPTSEDYRAHGKFAFTSLIRKFGSWNEFLERAGFEPTVNPDVSKEEMIDDYSRVAGLEETTATPTYNEYAEHGAYGTTTVRRAFGGFNPLVEQAGFEPLHPKYIGDLESELGKLRNILYWGLETQFKESSQTLQQGTDVCVGCNTEPENGHQAHHIIPATWGSSNTEDMLLPLCASCHTKADLFMRRELSEFATIPKLISEEQKKDSGANAGREALQTTLFEREWAGENC